jgi:hypothetical protein
MPWLLHSASSYSVSADHLWRLLEMTSQVALICELYTHRGAIAARLDDVTLAVYSVNDTVAITLSAVLLAVAVDI